MCSYRWPEEDDTDMQRSGKEGDVIGRGPGAASYTLHSPDGRLTVAVYRGRPTYLYVTHDGLTEDEVDAALLALAEYLPAPCCVIVLPDQV
jgi:hypothetical protein